MAGPTLDSKTRLPSLPALPCLLACVLSHSAVSNLFVTPWTAAPRTTCNVNEPEHGHILHSYVITCPHSNNQHFSTFIAVPSQASLSSFVPLSCLSQVFRIAPLPCCQLRSIPSVFYLGQKSGSVLPHYLRKKTTFSCEIPGLLEQPCSVSWCLHMPWFRL